MTFRRRRSRLNQSPHLNLEQLQQKREAVRLMRRADVIALGVCKYIEQDSVTSEEMADLGQILLDAASMADHAETALDAIYRIEEAEEAEQSTIAPN